MICEHEYVFQSTRKWNDSSYTYNIYWVKVDEYFCKKCLEKRDITKSEYSRDCPDWYKG